MHWKSGLMFERTGVSRGEVPPVVDMNAGAADRQTATFASLNSVTERRAAN
jgi:hypothetical protein